MFEEADFEGSLNLFRQGTVLTFRPRQCLKVEARNVDSITHPVLAHQIWVSFDESTIVCPDMADAVRGSSIEFDGCVSHDFFELFEVGHEAFIHANRRMVAQNVSTVSREGHLRANDFLALTGGCALDVVQSICPVVMRPSCGYGQPNKQ